jgi:PAS domain S-box-containing protein
VINLPRKWVDLIGRYGLAFALACAALLVRFHLPVAPGTTVYQLPVVAVVLSGWYGGRGPGYLAALVCTIVILYAFIPPENSWAIDAGHEMGLGIFVAVCILLVEFSASRWRIQRALEEGDRRLRLMAEAVPHALWFESVRPRRMLYASPRFEEIYRRPLRDFEHEPGAWLASIHPDDRPEVLSAHALWIAGEGEDRFDMTFRIVRPDGGERVIHARCTLLRDEGGAPYRASGIAEDVTEKKRSEEVLAKTKADLAHATRVGTMGQLAASIAHEVNQPLAAMVANAAACDFRLAASPPDIARARIGLKTIISDGQRAGAIVGRVRSFLKREPPRTDLIQINPLIREVLTLSQFELRRNGISADTALEDGLPPIRGDKVTLQQLLLNLIVNAMDAMTATQDGTRELRIASTKDGSGGVLVTIRDTGTGLQAENMSQLFEPFYTTKADGMGMGLAISQSAVQSHGGRIWASPNTPRGAIFQFTLPAATAESPAEAQEHSA